MKSNIKNLIFLDFEIDTKRNFFIVGKKINGEFQQIVLNDKLSGLANEKKLQVEAPKKFIYSLLDSAQNNSLLVAYSSAEREIFRSIQGIRKKYSSKDLQYLNLLKVAKRWVNKYKKNTFESLPPFRKNANSFQAKTLKNSLASIMRLTNFEIPPDYAPGKTTKRFNNGIKGLVYRNQVYENLTPQQKRNLTQAIKHNKFDVEALEVLYNECMKTDPSIIERNIEPLFEIKELVLD